VAGVYIGLSMKDQITELIVYLCGVFSGWCFGYSWPWYKQRFFSGCEHDWIPEDFADWKCSKCGVDR
jgi:hypothetical protein